jgi:hypothetical protein
VCPKIFIVFATLNVPVNLLIITLNQYTMVRQTRNALINYPKKDRATITDAVNCKFMACIALLSPSARSKADVGI